MSPIVWFSALAGTAPLIASTIPLYIFKNGINPRSFQILLGISAGLLFAIATLELIPELVEMSQLPARTNINHDDDEHARRSLFSTVPTSLMTDDDGDVDTEIQPTESSSSSRSGSNVHNDERKIRTGMLGLGAGFAFLILLEHFMSSGGHSHSHVGVHDHHDDADIEVCTLSLSLSFILSFQ